MKAPLPGEKITFPAVRVGDKVFTGSIHAIAQMEAQAEMGHQGGDVEWSDAGEEGFVTNFDRWLTREDARSFSVQTKQIKTLPLPQEQGEPFQSEQINLALA